MNNFNIKKTTSFCICEQMGKPSVLFSINNIEGAPTLKRRLYNDKNNGNFYITFGKCKIPLKYNEKKQVYKIY